MTTALSTCPNCDWTDERGVDHDTRCTMTDDEMRLHALRWLVGNSWQGDAMKQAATLDDAIRIGREEYGSSGYSGPHLPICHAGPHGVTYRRSYDEQPVLMTWREVALALRTGSMHRND